MRSRAVSFPCACCLSILSAPPPSRSRASSSRASAASFRNRSLTSGFLTLALDEPLLDVVDQVGGGSARAEQLADAELLQLLDVLLREDPATGDQDVVAPLLAEQLVDAGKERHVRA